MAFSFHYVAYTVLNMKSVIRNNISEIIDDEIKYDYFLLMSSTYKKTYHSMDYLKPNIYLAPHPAATRCAVVSICV